MGRYTYSRHDILRYPEVAQMVKRARPLWLKALIVLLWYTGARQSEILLLQPEDFCLEDGVCRILLPTMKRRKVGPFKSFRRTLTLPLKLPMFHYVLEHLRSVPPGTRLFYPHSDLKRARTASYARLKRLNPACSPHLFRHSRLTLFAEQGADLWALTEWAGWTSPAPAATYLHTAGRRAAQLSPLLFPTKNRRRSG